MKKSLHMFGCLAILAAPMIAFPAHAETSVPQGGDWHARHEMMESVRSDREELQGERDRIKEQCMDAKGQDRSACNARMDDLRRREASLHDHMMDVHEKNESLREERHEKKWKEHKASMKKGPMPQHTGSASSGKTTHHKKKKAAPPATDSDAPSNQ